MAGFPTNEAAGPVFQTKTKKTASPTKWRPWLCSFSTSLARLPTSPPPPPHSRTQIAALKTAVKEADELLLTKFKPKGTAPPPTAPPGYILNPPPTVPVPGR